jgi:hypothetical protein
MAEAETADDEQRKAKDQRLGLWLDFGKWVLGTFAIGAATIAVNWIIKDREVELAELEQQRIFLESFVTQAMEQDILVRVRLAHYIMTTTLNDDVRSRWQVYHREVSEECERQMRAVDAGGMAADCRLGGTERIVPPPPPTEIPQSPLPDWLARHETMTPDVLTPEEIDAFAVRANLEPSVLAAFAQVEGRGSPFLGETGLPPILFEGHVFHRLTDGRFSDPYPTISHRRWTSANYRGGRREYDRLAFAMSLDETAALEATSWGAFQIMGSNHDAAGFETVRAFVDAQMTHAGQFETILAFLEANPAMMDALRARDWGAFARRYNGPGYAARGYDERLATAYSSDLQRRGIEAEGDAPEASLD